MVSKLSAARLAVGAMLALSLLTAGCGDDDQITRYTIPNEADTAQDPLLAEPQARMLVAMIPEGNQAWFFKLAGPVDAVTQQADTFEKLIRSVSFQNGRAQWELPSGWEEQPGNTFREATLKIGDASPPLEVAVSKGPMRGESSEYLLDNVNRWRGQLQLAPIGSGQLAESVREVEVDGRKATLVDLSGKLNPGSMMATFAGGGASFPSGADSPSAAPLASRGAPAELSYQVPESWEPGELTVSRGGIRVEHEAAFVARDGNAQVVITATAMPRLGSMLSQVNRWRGQVGLEPTNQSQLEQQITSMEVAGEEGQAIVLEGEQETIQAVVVERSGTTWFFKLQGDRELAERERPRFEQFVKSIQFGSANGAENGQ